MKVVEWLENVQKLDFAVDELSGQLQEVRERAMKCTAGEMDGMPHAVGFVSDKVGNGVVNIVVMEARIAAKIDQYVDYRDDVIDNLMKLPPMQCKVLYLHYVGHFDEDNGTKKYMSWTEIARYLGYSVMQVGRIKKAALKNLENMMGDVIECYSIS